MDELERIDKTLDAIATIKQTLFNKSLKITEKELKTMNEKELKNIIKLQEKIIMKQDEIIANSLLLSSSKNRQRQNQVLALKLKVEKIYLGGGKNGRL